MPSFNSLRLTQRYMLVFCAYFLSMVVVIAISWHGLMNARDSLRYLHDQSLQRILLADSINESVAQARMQMLLAFQIAQTAHCLGMRPFLSSPDPSENPTNT